VRSSHSRARKAHVVLVLLAISTAAAGCGSSSSSSKTTKPTTLSLSIAEQGKAAKFTVPASATGGLTTVQLTNSGKAPHGAQLILVTGGHTVAEAVKQLGTNSPKTPAWLRAEGGIGSVDPGQSGTATVNLPKGTYAVVDTASLGGGGNGPPAYAPLTLSGGKLGTISREPTHIIGQQIGHDKYAWQITGLKAGANRVEFTSKGKSSIHLATAFKITGNANPSLAAIKKALQSNGPPPSYVDQKSLVQTAALDGGKSLTTSLTLTPGRYVFFCPLTDRDGGKPHFLEGMLKEVTVG
jgi:hypothetical protein